MAIFLLYIYFDEWNLCDSKICQTLGDRAAGGLMIEVPGSSKLELICQRFKVLHR